MSDISDIIKQTESALESANEATTQADDAHSNASDAAGILEDILTQLNGLESTKCPKCQALINLKK